jgi:outer membrane protein
MPRLATALLLLCTAAARAEEETPERLTVDDAVRIARANHPSVAAARAGVEAAGARHQQAWAPFLPLVTGSLAWQPQTANFAASPAFSRALAGGSVSVGVTCRPGDAGCTNPQPCVIPTTPGCVSTAVRPSPSGDLFNFYTAQVGVLWTLFDFGRTWYGWQAARANRDAAAAAVDATILQVTLDARVGFYGALAAQQLVAVAEESVATQTKHLAQMQGFFEVGTRTKVDVAQARADLASAQLNRARALGQREVAMATLHAALGLERWRPVALVEPTPPPDDEAPADAGERAVASRPEPRQLEKAALGAARQRLSFRGALFPSLQLALGPSWAGTSPDALTPNFSASLQLVLPFTGVNPVGVHGQMREQEANRLSFDEQGRALRNAIRLEAAAAAANLSAARQAIAAAAELLAAATERRELANGRFQAGLGTVLDLSDAELGYVNARSQSVQAVFDLGVAHARLAHALGK